MTKHIGQETDRAEFLSWRDWFPNLELPGGLTFDYVNAAAELLREWERGEQGWDWLGVYTVVKVYRMLKDRVEARLGGARSPSTA